MTSVLNVDSIAAKDGTSPVALTKQSANKYFVKYDAINNAVDGSLNSSSVTDNTTGVQTYNYTSNFTGSDYASTVTNVSRSSGNDTAYLSAYNGGGDNDMIAAEYTSALIVYRTKNVNGTQGIDMDPMSVINVGELA